MAEFKSSRRDGISHLKVYLIFVTIGHMRSKFLVTPSRIRFTKHAVEKFDMLKSYGFVVEEKQVTEPFFILNVSMKKATSSLPPKS